MPSLNRMPGRGQVRARLGERRSLSVEMLEGRLVLAGTSALAGHAYFDFNSNGSFDTSIDVGIPGVVIELTGTETGGGAVQARAMTDTSGAYRFTNIGPGQYTLTEQDPDPFQDGLDQVGSQGGRAENDRIIIDSLADGIEGANNDWIEGPLQTNYVTLALFFASNLDRSQFARELIARSYELRDDAAMAATARHGLIPSIVAIGNSTPGGNRAPIITFPPAVNVGENETAVVIVTASDADNDTLGFSISGGQDKLLFTIGPTTGALAFIAAPDFENPGDTNHDNVYQVTVTVSDGHSGLATQTVLVTVTNVNEPPAAPQLSAATIAENSVVGTVIGQLTASDPDDDSPLAFFLLTNGDGAFSINSSNQLVVSNPAKFNFESATSISIAVRVSDPSGAQNSAGFTIAITNVNEAPTAVSLVPNTVADNAAAGTVIGTISGVDPDAGDILTFSLATNPLGAFEIVGNQLRLAIAGALNAQTTSQVSVGVHATDAGGLPFDSTVVVNLTHATSRVNLAPSFSILTDTHTSNEDAGDQTIAPFLTNISPGPGESSQHVNFIVTPTGAGTLVFVSSPAISSDGTLTYRAAANSFGQQKFSVVAHDDGGTDNGGDDTSDSQTFTITVLAVNDAPAFTVQQFSTVLEDSATVTLPGFATVVNAGPANESGQAVHFEITNIGNPSLFAAGGAPQIDATGTLTYTPRDNANGTATITVRAVDDGGTDRGGIDISPPKTFDITVLAVNDAPTGILLSNNQIPAGSVNNTVVGTLSARDPDSQDTHQFAFASSGGTTLDADGRFAIVGNQLRVADTTKLVEGDDYQISVQATENGAAGLSVEVQFTIHISPASSADRTMSLADVDVDKDIQQTAAVPITVSQTETIQGIDLVIHYNTNLLDLFGKGQRPGSAGESVVLGAVLDGWTLDWNVNDAAGQLIVSAFNSSPLSASASTQTLFSLNFNLVSGVTGVADIEFSPIDGTNRTELNEGLINVTLVNGSVTVQ